MANPITPFPVFVTGGTNSVVGDTVRVTVYTGETARGTATGVLDSNKELLLDLGNSGVSVSNGDVLVVSENGSALGGTSITVTAGRQAEVTVSPTAVAFPSRTL